jgi:hypothetical protein
MTSTTTPTVTNLDKVCRNIGRLPLEMRHAIFNCLTVDFRLEMVLQKKAHIIRTLYEAYNERILDIQALQKIVDMGIRFRFFYNNTNGTLNVQPNLRRWMPNIEFKQMGDIVSTQHPAFKALRKIVVIPTIHGQIDSTSRRVHPARHASESLTKIVSTITKSCDILPTFTVPLGRGKDANARGQKFNYYVRKHTFQFICILTKFISKFEVQLENAAIEKFKQRQRKTFKRTVARYIPYMFRKMQRKIKLSAKIAKIAATKAKKDAKVAATKAKKDAKVAATKAKKELKEAVKNKK